MPTISTFEHATLRVGARSTDHSQPSVTTAEFDALARFNDAEGQRYFRLGHRRLTFSSFVGYIQVGKLGIEVLPKLGRDAVHPTQQARWQTLLLEMLRIAAGLPLHSPTEALRSVGRHTLLELVALRFIEQLERLLHEGLAKGYRTLEANGATFRGRLLGTQHVRANAARADRFYVRHSAFDRDIAVNRILGAALNVLDGYPLPPALLARLAACALTFPDCSIAGVRAADCDRVTLTRSTARYREALALARLILSHSAPELRAGAHQIFALLFDMNALWERYVGWIFRRAAPPECEVLLQESRPFWQAQPNPPRRVRPDLVVRERATGRNLLVLDAKWKVMVDGSPGDDDLKQMFVYNHLLGTTQAVLVYPSVEGGWHAPQGKYIDRAHQCGTMGLTLFDGSRLGSARMISQARALLDSVRAGVRAQ